MSLVKISRIESSFNGNPSFTSSGRKLSSDVFQTDSQLTLLRAQDPEAFRQLYIAYSGSILGIVNRLVLSREIAEDVMQEVFLKIWRSIALYDPEKGRLFTWMSKMARNSAIDYLRGKAFAIANKNEDLESSIKHIEQSHAIWFNSDRMDVRFLLSTLFPSQKEILYLVYFAGYTQAEVSEQLQIPLGTVKSKIRLAIQAMRSQLLLEGI